MILFGVWAASWAGLREIPALAGGGLLGTVWLRWRQRAAGGPGGGAAPAAALMGAAGGGGCLAQAPWLCAAPTAAPSLLKLGLFSPSFVFVTLTNPLVPRLRKSPLSAAFLDAVNAASLGLMGAVALRLGQLVFVPSLQPLAVQWRSIAIVR